MERSVEAKSHRSCRAWLYSKSIWEGFGGTKARVLERLREALGQRGQDRGGGPEAITEAARLEDDRRWREGGAGAWDLSLSQSPRHCAPSLDFLGVCGRA